MFDQSMAEFRDDPEVCTGLRCDGSSGIRRLGPMPIGRCGEVLTPDPDSPRCSAYRIEAQVYRIPGRDGMR
jgi:hypothetical protein